MLLNEFLKEHKKVAAQESKITELKTTVAQRQTQIEALTATVQKVSDQLELNKPGFQLTANNQQWGFFAPAGRPPVVSFAILSIGLLDNLLSCWQKGGLSKT